MFKGVLRERLSRREGAREREEMSTLRQKHRVLSIGLAMDEPGPAGCAGAVGRILGGFRRVTEL